MKKKHLTIATFILSIGLTACSDSGTSTTNAADSSTNASNNTAGSAPAATGNNTTSNTTTANKTPLTAQDSAFVMKAAIGGMMEVEAGTLAQEKATNDRVKAFGTMMVNDHNNANSELISLVSGRGVTAPSALPAAMQKHMEEMRKMTGKAFDKHYMNMMVNDHKKTIDDFQKQANAGSDAELKAWAAKKLPVLQMHRDSATAINKVIK